MAPCLGYAMGSSASPSAACCNGGEVAEQPGVVDGGPAGGLKSMTGRLGGNMRNAASIPSKCGVNVGVPISPNVDCYNYTNSSFLYVLIVNHALINYPAVLCRIN